MPSRISGACTPCRSKKQKCSGHHPSCSQCQSASMECTWPEQRKRGPAKGYIEALEARLHSAESLLLAILPLISDNQVDKASNRLHHDDEDDIEHCPTRKSSPPSLNKKNGQDYWDQFPLDTRKNIRKWQYDCEGHLGNSNLNVQYISHDGGRFGRRNRSLTGSPASAGLASPRGSISGIKQQSTSSWSHHMQPYVPASQNRMQAGAAQQLINMSNQQRQDQWMIHPQQHDHAHGQEAMQLDPSLIQPRTMPQSVPHIYAGNVQPDLFW